MRINGVSLRPMQGLATYDGVSFSYIGEM